MKLRKINLRMNDNMTKLEKITFGTACLSIPGGIGAYTITNDPEWAVAGLGISLVTALYCAGSTIYHDYKSHSLIQ